MKPNIKDVLADLELMKPEKLLKVEQDKTLETTVKELISNFDQLLKKHISSGYIIYYDYLDIVSKFKVTPQVIDRVIQTLFIYEYDNYEDYNSKVGMYLTTLVQASYNQGHNNFRLDLREFARTKPLVRPYGLGAWLAGSEKNRLKLTINPGTAWLGYSTGADAQYINMNVFGWTVDLGCRAKHSNFYVLGGVSTGGEYTEHCRFTIHGSTGNFFGRFAKNCQFSLPLTFVALLEEQRTEKIIWLESAQNCILRCKIEKALADVRSSVGKGCKLYLIEKGGDSLYAET